LISVTLQLASCILLKIIIEFIYINIISTHFNYMGFHYKPDNFNYILSWCFFFICFYFLKIIKHPISKFYLDFLFVLSLIPMFSFFGLRSESILYMSFTVLAFIIICLLQVRKIDFNFNIRNGTSISILLTIFLSFIVIIHLVTNGALSKFNFDFKLIYDVRDELSDTYSSGFFAYLNSWVMKVCNLFLIVLTIKHKKYFTFILLIGIQVWYFGVTAHKSILFFPLVSLFIWFHMKIFNKDWILSLAVSVMSFISLLTYLFFDNLVLASMFVRRVLFVPARLNFEYYNFFSENTFVMLQNKIFSLFGSYDYDSTPAIMIGNFIGIGANSNVGFLGTGYMHFGFVGMIIFSLIVGLIINVFSSLADKLGEFSWIVPAVSIIPIISLLRNSDLFTALLTQGVLVSFIILSLYSLDNDKNAQ
jgi:hypothetical protein